MPSRDELCLWLSRCILPHEPALRSWLHSKNVPFAEVDDIVQETYCRLSSVVSFESIRNPRAYMFRTAHCIRVDQIRRSRIVPILAVGLLETFEIPSEQPSPETQVHDLQELQRLARVIATLPGKVRDVFILRRVHGLSQRETAVKLDLSESTVEKYIARSFLLISDAYSRGGNPPCQPSNEGETEPESANAKDQ